MEYRPARRRAPVLYKRARVREWLCLLFANWAGRLAGQTLETPIVIRRGLDVAVITHACFKVILEPGDARMLARDLNAATRWDEPGQGRYARRKPEPSLN